MVVQNKGRIISGILVVIMVFIAGPSLAQDKPADNMQYVQEKIRADKKLLVAANLELTESQDKAFWPVYESYQKRLEKINNSLAELIADYAKNYKNMTDEAAKRLVNNYMAFEADRLKLRQEYLPRFRKVIPDTKVMTYYQLENKIHAVVAYELARAIPIVEK
jgi:hypothetical protein